VHIVIAMYFNGFFNEVDLVEDKGFLVPQRADIIMAAYGDNNYELNQRRRLVWSCSVMCDVWWEDARQVQLLGVRVRAPTP